MSPSVVARRAGSVTEQHLEHLRATAAEYEARGIPVPPLEGKLLRPAFACSLVPPGHRGDLDDGFWRGALAIQMVHEASLLHDDIVDEAVVRRGRPTVAAQRGIGPALVLGDHYLTAAYRIASDARSPVFLQVFIEAVERTVAGEILQGRSAGHPLDADRYEEIIGGKSGELFGAAAVLVAERVGADPGAARALGRSVGAFYQRIDDFLDYCDGAATGKSSYQDYAQRKYTFVLAEAGVESFDLPVASLHARLFRPDANGEVPMRRAMQRLEALRWDLLSACGSVFGHREALDELLTSWVTKARHGFQAALVQPAPVGRSDATPAASVVAAARAVGAQEEWPRYFGRNSKSFRFASLLFPAGPRADVTGVYAFCRFTDDLVDESTESVEGARARLAAWRHLARESYEGRPVGVPLADVVMGRAREMGVPFHYVDELLTGVGMDLEPSEFATVSELKRYTYRVASVVGGWITELFGLRDEEILSRAFALGHAMQLTNILRDVGDDWRMGRLYLPRDAMDRFGVGREDVGRIARTGVADDRWIDLTEHLMRVAEEHYRLAEEALPSLPGFYRRPVAVAARVYQGIHDAIRRNDYDNGTRRAYTGLATKVRLGIAGLRAGGVGRIEVGLPRVFCEPGWLR